MKKTISIVLAFILVFCVFGPIPKVEARYLYIKSIAAGLSIDSTGKCLCTGYADALNSQVILTVFVELQRYNSTVPEWQKVAGTWSDTDNGLYPVLVSERCTVQQYGPYRVKVTVEVRSLNGVLLDREHMYSRELLYY